MLKYLPTIVLMTALSFTPVDGQNRRRVRRRAAPPPPVSLINKIGEPHTFTVVVETEANNGQWGPVENAHVTITLTNAGGAVATPPGPFTGVTDADGHFSCTINSATIGTITAHAVATWQSLTAATDGIPPNGSDVVKTYVTVQMRITFQ